MTCDNMLSRNNKPTFWTTSAVVKTVEPNYIILSPLRDKNISYMIYTKDFPGMMLTEDETVRLHLEHGYVRAIEQKKRPAE